MALYEPKRIAHYPDNTIDVVVSATVDVPLSPPVSLTSAFTPLTNGEYPTQSPPHLSSTSMDLSLSSLSLYTSSFTGPLSSQPKHSTNNTVSIIRPMEALSDIASDITRIQNQLNRSTDQQSAYHQELLESLVRLLQEQAEAKERDRQVLAELEAAKVRDKELLQLQKQTTDRLIAAQQRIDAVLVQNYELHEYPIPRLFVILPDSYDRWDPRNIVAGRFRLFFLCECGDHCRADESTPSSSGQLTIAAASPTANTIPVKNNIHLAKHEGYELSRPTEFFDRYGPYVLGMLRVLKHCLAVASVVAPAVALVNNTIKDAMDGVKSISESTMKAVDASIDFLERKLDDHVAADDVAETNVGTSEEEDRFGSLSALGGADLRRLDSFLKNKDADKILGNLYRITTEAGHVKWVCLDHYHMIYRATAMESFLQCVEANGGTYDPQIGKVSITLKSRSAAKDFLSKLSSHAQAVTSLSVTFDWSFGSTDLAMLVDRIAHSNVGDFELNLMERTPTV
ncbi:hypothetical protein EC991_006467 [Linnemannia zychae]|nr:hypothetical protein EC991_006467 [Linnemannia zychae]